MLPFLVTIGIIGVLIVCGVRVSLYLYKQGVFSRRRFRRSRRNQAPVEEEETEGEEESDSETGAIQACCRGRGRNFALCPAWFVDLPGWLNSSSAAHFYHSKSCDTLKRFDLHQDM